MPKLKYRLLVSLIFGALLSFGANAISSPKASALICPDGFDAGTVSPNQIENSDPCANHQTGSNTADDAEANDPARGSNLEANCQDKDGNGALDGEECGIVGYIILFTNILSGAVGAVIVIMIAVGGIQYTTSRDDPQAVLAAKNRIKNAVLALVFYLFGFAFLQYLIPGGIF
jgi:hypothetical protein